MFIADAHCDTLFSIGVMGRSPQECCVTAPRMAEGGMGMMTFAMFAGAKGPAGTPYEDGKKMLAVLDRPGVPVFRDLLPETPPETPCAVVSVEGGEVFRGSLDLLREFDREAHLRLIALTWNFENEIGCPAANGPEGGLKPFGLDLLREMDRLGICADVSHLNEAGFWDVCEHAKLPPVASHSNCRWLCDVPRNLYRDQVEALIARGGFIGANFYTRFLTKENKSTLEDVFRHIDAVCELGGEKVIGFGSDFDGIEAWPEGLAHPADFPRLIGTLRDHGYSEETIADIAGMNYWRLLKRAEEARTR